MQEEEMSNFF